MDSSGSSKTSIIALGIMMQLVWLGFILTACWFIQKGSILVWWCTVCLTSAMSSCDFC